jgi:trehalose 6-phosphate phosphatase
MMVIELAQAGSADAWDTTTRAGRRSGVRRWRSIVLLGGIVMGRRLFDAMSEVGQRISQAPYLLLCLDFDGTLAPIEADPGLPTLSLQVERALWSLAAHDGISMAILSGRERGDLQARVGVPGLYYAGNHGLEISGPGSVFVEPTAAAQSAQIKILGTYLAKELQPVSGALVEDKGLTLSIHYRRVAAANHATVRQIVRAALAGTTHTYRLTMGEKVYEIRPNVSWNKGAAALWIRDRMGKPGTLVIYIGDDVTDEDAFVVFPEGITVKVRHSRNTAAHYLLENTAEVRRFLEWVDNLLRQKTNALLPQKTRSQTNEPGRRLDATALTGS